MDTQLQAPSPESKYPRGLTFEEVSFIKAARARGFVNNYIMGFIHYPGRSISNAVIDDVTAKNRAPDVPEMTQSELDAFIAKRLAHHRHLQMGDDTGPLSTYMISQELGWILGSQQDLFVNESTRIEFKRELPQADQLLSGCLITMSAFANKNGGYIIFGVTDREKTVAGISPEKWNNFDWNRYSELCASLFQPSIDWDHRLVEYNGHSLGVIYVESMEKPPTVSTKDWHRINPSTIYFRYAHSSQRILPGDLLKLLDRRDDFVRRADK